MPFVCSQITFDNDDDDGGKWSTFFRGLAWFGLVLALLGNQSPRRVVVVLHIIKYRLAARCSKHVNQQPELENLSATLKSQLLSLTVSKIINPKTRLKKSAYIDPSWDVSQGLLFVVRGDLKDKQQLNLRDCNKFLDTCEPIIWNGNQVEKPLCTISSVKAEVGEK